MPNESTLNLEIDSTRKFPEELETGLLESKTGSSPNNLHSRAARILSLVFPEGCYPTKESTGSGKTVELRVVLLEKLLSAETFRSKVQELGFSIVEEGTDSESEPDTRS